MRYLLKTVVSTIMAILMLSAVTTTTAAAAGSTALPEFSVDTLGTATGSTASLNLEGISLPCSKSTSTFGAGKKLGTLTITFDECKAGGKECKSLGAGTETITAAGTWLLVSLVPWRTHYLMWLLLGGADNSEAVHIECAGSLIGLVLVWGSLLGLIIGAGTHYSLDIKRATTTKQEIEEFGNNSGEVVKVSGLKAKLGTGTARVATEGSLENNLTMAKATTILES